MSRNPVYIVWSVWQTKRTFTRWIWLTLALLFFHSDRSLAAGQLKAGVAKVDITNRVAGPVNDPLYVKVLALGDQDTTLLIATVDAVAIGGIGPIPNDYMSTVRATIERDLNIPPMNFVVNASHCHGVVRADVAELTIQAIQKALSNMQPVVVGSGVGHEDRIMENRRLRLKSGKEADVRHAYSLPPDDEVASVGKIDPEIGVLRVNLLNGDTLAVLYNFACHPIQGVPSGGNTADLVGFASKVLEENLSPGTMALFLQGCGGDINPVLYKDVNQPRDAESHGLKLGLSTLKAVRSIECNINTGLAFQNRVLELPRVDATQRIDAMESEQQRLVQSLQGTSLNFKSFLPLLLKYQMDQEFPSYYSHRYLQEKQLGRQELARMDVENKRNMKLYLDNIHTMEQLTRLQTNLALLKMHRTENLNAPKRTIDVELTAFRIGDFRVLTFPGELTIQIGLNIKRIAPKPNTFVAGYTNGYIYYCPTVEQLANIGGAQEDSDCIVAPEWQELFEKRAAEMLSELH